MEVVPWSPSGFKHKTDVCGQVGTVFVSTEMCLMCIEREKLESLDSKMSKIRAIALNNH